MLFLLVAGGAGDESMSTLGGAPLLFLADMRRVTGTTGEAKAQTCGTAGVSAHSRKAAQLSTLASAPAVSVRPRTRMSDLSAPVWPYVALVPAGLEDVALVRPGHPALPHARLGRAPHTLRGRRGALVGRGRRALRREHAADRTHRTGSALCPRGSAQTLRS